MKISHSPAIILLIGCMAVACNSKKTTTEEDAQQPPVSTSFYTPGAGEVVLASICNADEVAEHMERYPERWKAAFDFLAAYRLDTLANGEYELLPEREVYAAVSSYVPRDTADCNFESHRQYIDLQYIVSGHEGMGVTRDTTLTVVKPFENTDFAGYSPEGAIADYDTADSTKYFLFFPADVHRPCLRVDSHDAAVKKVVVKIRY